MTYNYRLDGKKSNITRMLVFEYYGSERMGLTNKTLKVEAENMADKMKALQHCVQKSFLSHEMQERYLELLETRFIRMRTS